MGHEWIHVAQQRGLLREFIRGPGCEPFDPVDQREPLTTRAAAVIRWQVLYGLRVRSQLADKQPSMTAIERNGLWPHVAEMRHTMAMCERW